MDLLALAQLMPEKKINLEAEKNADALLLSVAQMSHRLYKIYDGGGVKRIEKLHAEGKMTARERIDYLLDAQTPRLEIGAFAGYELYPEHGGCPAGGVVVSVTSKNNCQSPSRAQYVCPTLQEEGVSCTMITTPNSRRGGEVGYIQQLKMLKARSGFDLCHKYIVPYTAKRMIFE